jgi:hypothetical protein
MGGSRAQKYDSDYFFVKCNNSPLPFVYSVEPIKTVAKNSKIGKDYEL